MLGTRIAALRVSAGMSQAELARKLTVSTSTIGMYEQGRREPSGCRLVLLGRLFGVTTDYLLTGQPVCDQDRTVLSEMARHGAAQAQRRQGRRQGRGFSTEELQVLLTAMVEQV